MRYVLSREELRQQLREQMIFLNDAAVRFDRGAIPEAKQAAARLRIVLIDTRHMRSLLTHLEAWDMKLLSTCRDIMAIFRDRSSLAFGGRLGMWNGMTLPMSNQPKLGNGSTQEYIPARQWLKQIVLAFTDNPFSREDIIKYVANKDGGAHVDAELPMEYVRLKGGAGDFGYHVRQLPGGGESMEPLVDMHLKAIRQLAYELLNSVELLDLAGCKYKIVDD